MLVEEKYFCVILPRPTMAKYDGNDWGLFTYYVSQNGGFVDRPPPRQQKSAFG